MTETVIPYRFLCRGGTAAAIAALNDVPKARELYVETDTGRVKLGDGSTAYNSLPYIGPGQFDLTGLADGDAMVWDAGTDMFVPAASVGGGTSTAWASAASVIDATTTAPTKGTIVTDAMWWRRVGDSMEIRCEYEQSTAGASGSGDYLFEIPDGQSIDTAKMTAYTGAVLRTTIGHGVLTDQSTFSAPIFVIAHNATNLRLWDTTLGPLGGGVRGMGASAKWTLSFQATVPIDGW